MNKKLLAYLILTFYISVQSMAQDSLVYFNELKYHSTFEKEVFRDYFKNNKQNYLALLLATVPKVDRAQYTSYEKRYREQVEAINTDKLSKKRVEKKIKSIYEEVHQRFLRKYEAQNSMNAIFTNGSYNCVSASALYSLVFEDLNIPYSIQEKPTHVYVLAYPKSERILVESTDPKGGFIPLDDKYKRAFVKQMVQSKIISSSEANTQSENDLFDQYFFTDQEITLKELVGIQYVNEGLYLLERDEKMKALNQMEKAYFFFNQEKLKVLLLAMNIEILTESKYESLDLVENFIKLTRFKGFEITEDDLLAEFARISTIYLDDQSKPEMFRQFYESIVSQLKDDKLKEEISFLYFYEQGRVLYNEGEYAQCLPYFEKAYQLKPKNSDISRLLVSTIGLQLSNESNVDLTTKTLEDYKERLPGLLKNKVFKSFLVSSYLIQFGQAFDLGNEKKGLKYKLLFEQNFTKDLNINKTNVGRAYSLTAVYYFRKGYSSKARSILNTGLEIAPGNHELLTRKRLIN